MTPVKDQGQCGSCYTFSATGAIEGAYAIKTGDLIELSMQQVRTGFFIVMVIMDEDVCHYKSMVVMLLCMGGRWWTVTIWTMVAMEGR